MGSAFGSRAMWLGRVVVKANTRQGKDSTRIHHHPPPPGQKLVCWPPTRGRPAARLARITTIQIWPEMPAKGLGVGGSMALLAGGGILYPPKPAPWIFSGLLKTSVEISPLSTVARWPAGTPRGAGRCRQTRRAARGGEPISQLESNL